MSVMKRATTNAVVQTAFFFRRPKQVETGKLKNKPFKSELKKSTNQSTKQVLSTHVSATYNYMLIKIFYRHEREKHQDIPADSGSNNEPSEEQSEDHKYYYHVTRLFYGLVLWYGRHE